MQRFLRLKMVLLLYDFCNIFTIGNSNGNMLIMKADELKQWRENWNLSREELARELKTTSVTIWRWEKGLRGIPPYLHLALIQIQGTFIEMLSEQAVKNWLVNNYSEHKIEVNSEFKGFNFFIKSSEYVELEKQRASFGVKIYNSPPLAPSLSALDNVFKGKTDCLKKNNHNGIIVFIIFSDQNSFEFYTDNLAFTRFDSQFIYVVAGYVEKGDLVVQAETPNIVFFLNHN
jgi:transcriptional regulator with XRE-family HTH domain